MRVENAESFFAVRR